MTYYSFFLISRYVKIPIPIITRANPHFAQLVVISIAKPRLIASSEARKTKLKSHFIGRAIQVHPVRLASTTAQNPPIVIIGTKGTMIRLITTPVKLVCPIKKRRIGKVPKVAQRVGNP